jgi:hypothetical protein
MSDLGVSPPDSLMKYDAPLFVGIEPSANGGKMTAEGLSKLDDMINSMLPPRYGRINTARVSEFIICVDILIIITIAESGSRNPEYGSST